MVLVVAERGTLEERERRWIHREDVPVRERDTIVIRQTESLAATGALRVVGAVRREAMRAAGFSRTDFGKRIALRLFGDCVVTNPREANQSCRMSPVSERSD